MLKIISLIATVLFLAAGILLGVLNPTPIKLDLFWLTPTLPLSLIMAFMFIFGLFLGSLLMAPKVLRLRWQLNKESKRNRKQANQIIELKAELSKKQEAEQPSNLPALNNK
ncbi:LapA family protein [Thiomicrorhabdus indica]|uniref:LapA family protein n=1 Tax=Thiomicrorhabdus indica TaxID=2267253 RepID=UPI002AA8B6D7|nr:LapA family protein [Thiomicrorhabdus indica]